MPDDKPSTTQGREVESHDRERRLMLVQNEKMRTALTTAQAEIKRLNDEMTRYAYSPREKEVTALREANEAAQAEVERLNDKWADCADRLEIAQATITRLQQLVEDAQS